MDRPPRSRRDLLAELPLEVALEALLRFLQVAPRPPLAQEVAEPEAGHGDEAHDVIRHGEPERGRAVDPEYPQRLDDEGLEGPDEPRRRGDRHSEGRHAGREE